MSTIALAAAAAAALLLFSGGRKAQAATPPKPPAPAPPPTPPPSTTQPKPPSSTPAPTVTVTPATIAPVVEYVPPAQVTPTTPADRNALLTQQRLNRIRDALRAAWDRLPSSRGKWVEPYASTSCTSRLAEDGIVGPCTRRAIQAAEDLAFLADYYDLHSVHANVVASSTTSEATAARNALELAKVYHLGLYDRVP